MFDAAAQSLPGVEAAAWISSAPFSSGCAPALGPRFVPPEGDPNSALHAE
jgi:hypothetical protein